MTFAWLALMAMTGSAATASDPPGPFGAAPQVEIEGVITRLDLRPGMPVLELQTAKGSQTVVLGSIRYLMERNFNPKAGAVAVVKGFAYQDRIFARRIEIPSARQSIELRDAKGFPLWRGGRWK